ncbi:MAG: hypothetical protein K2G50_00920, partial [Anaeroplasmataceae bacterium]|nr:hypothetical protein [Anaeroplasmataceae bacterium]
MVEEIKNPIDDNEVQTEEVSVVDEVNNSNDAGSQEETYKEMSPLRLVVRRFFRSKLSIVGVVMIIGLFIFSFFGPLVCRMTGYGKAWTEDAWQLNGSIETKADRTEITSIVQEYFYYTDPE